MDHETVIASSACESCPAHHAANLHRLGVDMTDWDYVVALAGNPNTGKSTVFNALTGLRQHTGNWPGKTVTRAEGGYEYNQERYKLVDLPGTYSLLATSPDEEVARDFILFGRPDATVIVVDGTRLERNLNLVLQVLEITDRVVVCLNLMDEVQRHGWKIEDRLLGKELGVPVVPTIARTRGGFDQLLEVIADISSGRLVGRPHHRKISDPGLEKAVSKLTRELDQLYPDLPNQRWVAMRLLAGDESIETALRNGEIGDLKQDVVRQGADEELNLKEQEQ
ncbi:MAG: 50S ribosome-binding GTPase [Anaerolineales bacterium]|nr:50S ribosome-binding GTPase [Anaerolineales bacterium]